ncbi:MAG TPA: hypothetical protein VIW21_09800 [Chthoniobacterales bacterium]
MKTILLSLLVLLTLSLTACSGGGGGSVDPNAGMRGSGGGIHP